MRRAMTCVYWEPKSRMTICSFMQMKGKSLPPKNDFGETKKGNIARSKNCWNRFQQPLFRNDAYFAGRGVVGDFLSNGRVGNLADQLRLHEFIEALGKTPLVDVEHLDGLVERRQVNRIDGLGLAAPHRPGGIRHLVGVPA